MPKFRPSLGKTFPGCWNASRVLVGASLTASRELRKMRRVPHALVVNWIGGLGACASYDTCVGHSYLNDLVLSITDLRKTFETVAVVSIGGAHSAAPEAFEYSNTVLTCSLHRYDRDAFTSGRRKWPWCGR